MSERDAVWRLMQEIMIFTDRPDYSRPKTVRQAFGVLQEIHGITEEYLYKNYCKTPDDTEDEID